MKIEDYIKRYSQGVGEITQDIIDGKVPNTITSFSDLHDYLDANEYCGFCKSDYKLSKDFLVEMSIQRDLDLWIKKTNLKNL